MLEIKKEKTLLVGVDSDEVRDITYSMEELKNLVLAAGYEVIDQVVQKMEHPHNTTYVGKGKLEEINELVDKQDIDVVIFNDELTPLQIRQIEEVLECELLDRSLIILDIFASRAKTKEAMLQVEISRLQYVLPRLIGARSELSRQGGGTGGGLKNRGAGETKLELDQRRIKAQITKKQRELKQLVAERQVARKQRKKQGYKTIALVGYTNAGKSTLMNVLLQHSKNEKEVFVKDMLFATLETKTRLIELAHKQEVILTDTVGFVDKLPHHLVKAFRSTLEEVKEADLLLHVIDYSNPFYHEQMQVTLDVLNDLDIEDIPILNVYNKMDQSDEKYPYVKKHKIFLSAKENIGINLLLEEVEKQLYGEIHEIQVCIPFSKSSLVSKLHETYEVIKSENTEEGVELIFYGNDMDIKEFQKYMKENKT